MLGTGEKSPPAALPAGVEDMGRHPGWWAAAADLQPGDRLHTPSGWSEVVSVKPRTSVDRVYNLTVEHDHLFRVGPDAVLVHNNCQVDDLLEQIGMRVTTKTGDGAKLTH